MQGIKIVTSESDQEELEEYTSYQDDNDNVQDGQSEQVFEVFEPDDDTEGMQINIEEDEDNTNQYSTIITDQQET